MGNRSINLIVIHCSATPSGQSIGGNPALVIDAWHQARGFKRSVDAAQAFQPALPHIGYHRVIDVDGRVFMGRHPDEVGAHAAQFNAHSLGVCLVGGKERDARYTPAQWDALRRLMLDWSRWYRIPLQPPRRMFKATSPGYNVVVGVCGHRDLSPDKDGDGLVEPFEWLKTCPGFDVGEWLARDLQPKSTQVYTGAAS